MLPDCDLLRQYAECGDEAAFAEVVRRYADLVYSVALRLTAGNTHLAQDVAQRVFIGLARKAGALSRHATLVGWLHMATRYAARSAIRGEQRRQIREQEAPIMHETSSSPEPDWGQIRPLLDEAVGQLGPTDGEAVLLRFFQGKSHAEVGAALGLSEDSARKRVDRALEKLHKYFTQKGVRASSVLLATTIMGNSVQAAPINLAAEWSAFAHANRAAADVGLDALVKQTSWLNRRAKILTFATMGILALGTWMFGLASTKSSSAIQFIPTVQAVDQSKSTKASAVESPKALPVKAGGGAQLSSLDHPPLDPTKVPRMYFSISGANIRNRIGTDTGADLDAKLNNFFIHEGFKFPPGTTLGYDKDKDEMYLSGIAQLGAPRDIATMVDDFFEKYSDPVAWVTRDGTVIYYTTSTPSSYSFPPNMVTYVDENGTVITHPHLPRLLNSPEDSTETVEAVRILSDWNDSLLQGTVTVRVHMEQTDTEEWSIELDAARAKK